MSENQKNLGNARGLNSIADPRSFKGTSGRARRRTNGPAPEVDHDHDQDHDLPAAEPPAPEPRRGGTDAPEPSELRLPTRNPNRREPAEAAGAGHAARLPATGRALGGLSRTRRELSVPHQIADAVDKIGINPADLVMAAYRRHGDAIYAGVGGRMVVRGRRRLRLTISDSDFDQITRLGRSRGWNRSETVSVILAMELMPDAVDLPFS
ncbi:MAG: hypothetical protein ACK5RL_12775 [Acidimicrobiales bacterium]